MTRRLFNLVRELPKSKLPASAAVDGGQYVFYVSSRTPLLCDDSCREGEALILSTGGTAAVHYGKGQYAYSTDCWALEPCHEYVDGRFLYYFLVSQIDRIDALGFEGSGLKHLRKSFIREYPVPVFSRQEQSVIGDVLLMFDRVIDQTEALIAKQQRIKIGLMQDLLTRGIDEHGNLRSEHTHEFKDSPLGRISAEWDILPLCELAKLDRGKFTHRPRNDHRFYGGDFPFIQTGDVTSRTGRVINSYSQTLNHRGKLVSKCFPSGTIAVTIAANIADTAILGLPMYLPDSIVVVNVKRPHSTRFIELMIRRWKPILECRAPQSAQKNINLETLLPLAIPTPPPKEQERIGALYDSVDAVQEMTENNLRKLFSLRTALMQDLVTGNRRVTPLLEQREEAKT